MMHMEALSRAPNQHDVYKRTTDALLSFFFCSSSSDRKTICDQRWRREVMVDDLLLRHRRDQLQHQLHTLKDLLAPVYGEIIQEIGAIVDRLQILREQSIAHYFVVADMSDLLHVWRQNFDVRPILKFQTNSVEENGNLPSIVNLVAIEAERQLRSACANVHNLKREQIDGLVGVQRSKLVCVCHVPLFFPPLFLQLDKYLMMYYRYCEPCGLLADGLCWSGVEACDTQGESISAV